MFIRVFLFSLLANYTYSSCDKIVNECEITASKEEVANACIKLKTSSGDLQCVNVGGYICKEESAPGDGFLDSVTTVSWFQCDQNICKATASCTPPTKYLRQYDCKIDNSIQSNISKIGNLKNSIVWSISPSIYNSSLNVSNKSLWKKEAEYWLSSNSKSSINKLNSEVQSYLNCLGIGSLKPIYHSNYQAVEALVNHNDLRANWYARNNYYFNMTSWKYKKRNPGTTAARVSKSSINKKDSLNLETSALKGDFTGSKLNFPEVFVKIDGVSLTNDYTNILKTREQKIKFAAYIIVHEIMHQLVSASLDSLLAKEPVELGMKSCPSGFNGPEFKQQQYNLINSFNYSETHHIPNTLLAEGNPVSLGKIALEIVKKSSSLSSLCKSKPNMFGWGNLPKFGSLIQNYVKSRVKTLNENNCYKPCMVPTTIKKK